MKKTKWAFREASRNVHIFDVNLKGSGDEQWFLLQSDVHWDNPKCDRKKLKRHLDEAVKRYEKIVAPIN